MNGWYKVAYSFQQVIEPGPRDAWDDRFIQHVNTYNATHGGPTGAIDVGESKITSRGYYHEVEYLDGNVYIRDFYNDGYWPFSFVLGHGYYPDQSHYPVITHTEYWELVHRVVDVVVDPSFAPTSNSGGEISFSFSASELNRVSGTVSHVAYEWFYGDVSVVDIDGNGYDDAGEHDDCPGQRRLENKLDMVDQDLANAQAELTRFENMTDDLQVRVDQLSAGIETLTTLDKQILALNLAEATAEFALSVTPVGRAKHIVDLLLAGKDFIDLYAAKNNAEGAPKVVSIVDFIFDYGFELNGFIDDLAKGLAAPVATSLEVLDATRDHQKREAEINELKTDLANTIARQKDAQARAEVSRHELEQIGDALRHYVDCLTWADQDAGVAAAFRRDGTALLSANIVAAEPALDLITPDLAVLQASQRFDGALPELLPAGVTRLVVTTSGADDVIGIGSAQASLIDAGEGYDVVRFAGPTSAIESIYAVGGALYLEFANGARATLVGVEQLTSADGVFRANLGPAGAWEVRGSEIADTLTGTSAADDLYGLGGADTLNSGDGSDTLDGGPGADTMRGGSGNDTYYVGDVGDQVAEAADQGIDLVYSTVSFSLAGQAAEALTLTGSAPSSATGNAEANVLTGNEAGNSLSGAGGDDILYGNGGADTLEGGEGQDWLQAGEGADTEAGGGGNDSIWGGADNDWLEGGAGDDTIDGGAGLDTASYANAGSRVEIDLGVLEDQTTRGAGLDTLISIENVAGSAFDDVLTGNGLANMLLGGLGADSLTGGGGNDSIWGGADNDWLEGGAGDDTIDGGAGLDTASYANAGSRVEIDLGVLEDQTTRGAGLDTLVSIENVVGSAFDDVLTGNGLANMLLGGLGADSLTGGGGVDVFLFQTSSQSAVAAFDRITDFAPGDRIDLSMIDANANTVGDDPFAFIGAATFGHVAGQLRVSSAVGGWMVEADANGDGSADMAFVVTTVNSMTLQATDFLL